MVPPTFKFTLNVGLPTSVNLPKKNLSQSQTDIFLPGDWFCILSSWQLKYDVMSQSCRCESRRTGPFLICYVVLWVREILPPLQHSMLSAAGGRAGLWFCPSPTAAIRGAGPVTHFGKTVEIALEEWVQGRQTQGPESWITGPACCLHWVS